MTRRVYQAAGKILRAAGKLAGVADEGGFWPVFVSNEEPLELLVRAIERAGYEPGRDVALSLDFAASDYRRKLATLSFQARRSPIY